ncbi:orexin receptor type 2-like [Diabrotica undecimpunctata]|uniref:orexin receptor type 2-like n=1 Tax=Diabrotica undecimpunctata TaxID=50387 RepID=UPI003B6391E2
MNETNKTHINIPSDLEEKIWKSFAINNFVVIGLYIPVLIVAATANLLFIAIVIKHRYMRRASTYLLINLSIADLLITLFAMPSAMWSAYTPLYSLGKYGCKILTYIECVSVSTSILTITAMSLHRYFAITKPLFGLIYPSFNRCGTTTLIIFLWILSMIIFSPVLWVNQLEEDVFPTFSNDIIVYYCKEDWKDFIISRNVMGILWFVFVFLIPGLIMLFAYFTMGKVLCCGTQFYEDSTSTYQRERLIRTRKKVACILLLLALMFAICWMPHHIANLLNDTDVQEGDLSDTNPDENDFQNKLIKLKDLKRYLLLLGHLNSALNPIVYVALSKKFRKSIQELFCKGTCESQKELTRVTLMKLNTLRNPYTQDSRSTTTHAKKLDERDASNGTAH